MANPRTTFGTLIRNFHFQRKMALEKGEQDLWERNKLADPTKRKGYKVVETSSVNNDGSTTHSLELWKRVDQEHIRISTNVEVNKLVEENKETELGDLLA